MNPLDSGKFVIPEGGAYVYYNTKTQSISHGAGGFAVGLVYALLFIQSADDRLSVGRFFGWVYGIAAIGGRMALPGILAEAIPLDLGVGALFVTDGASGLSGLAAYLAYRFHYGQNQLGDWFLYGVPRLLDCSGAVFFAAVGFFAAETETPLKEKGGAYVLRVFYAAFSRLGGALSKS